MSEKRVKFPGVLESIPAEVPRFGDFRVGQLVMSVSYIKWRHGFRATLTSNPGYTRIDRSELGSLRYHSFQIGGWEEIGQVVEIDEERFSHMSPIKVLFPSTLIWVQVDRLWIIPERLYRKIP